MPEDEEQQDTDEQLPPPDAPSDAVEEGDVAPPGDVLAPPAAEPEQPEPVIPAPEQPEPTVAEPEQPEAVLAAPEQPEPVLAAPEQPEPTVAEPQQPEPVLAAPEQPEAVLPEPEQLQIAPPEYDQPEPAPPIAPDVSTLDTERTLLAAAEPEWLNVDWNAEEPEPHGDWPEEDDQADMYVPEEPEATPTLEEIGQGDTELLWQRTSATASLSPVSDGDGLCVPGDIGTTPVSGAGVRLMWIPGKKALRAGEAGSTEWDAANIGDYSVAFGLTPTASGFSSLAIGMNATASGDYAQALGSGVTASGDSAIVIGLNCTNATDDSFAVGYGQIDLLVEAAATSVKGGDELRLWMADNSKYFGLKCVLSTPSNTVYETPTAFPLVSGQALTSTTAGVMSWAGPFVPYTGANDNVTIGNFTFTAANIVATNTVTVNGLTATRVVFAGASGLLSGDAGFIFDGDCLIVGAAAQRSTEVLHVKDGGVTATNGYVVEFHADDALPYVLGLFNDASSTSVPYLSAYGSAGDGFLSLTGLLSVTRSTFPVFKITRTAAMSTGVYYSAARLYGSTTGTAAANTGVVFDFTMKNSAGTETYAGMFGGGLFVKTAGSEQGDVVIAPAYGGIDPSTRRDLMLRATAAATSQLIFAAGVDIVAATTTGTKIGTATNQLLGFYGATPVDRPATVADATTQGLAGSDTIDVLKVETDLDSCMTAINAVIARLKELGLIA